MCHTTTNQCSRKVEHGIIPEDTSLPYVPSEDFVYMPGERHNPTASRIARENNVSHGTVEKYAIYSRAIDEIADKEPDIVPKILGGKYKISHNNVVELSKLSAEDIKKVGRRIEKMNQPYVQYKNTRGIIPKKNVSGVGEPLPPAPSIKDMPAFDPDAEITGLTLTIPSWGSSIERVRTKSDLTIVSNGARQKLVNALSELALCLCPVEIFFNCAFGDAFSECLLCCFFELMSLVDDDQVAVLEQSLMLGGHEIEIMICHLEVDMVTAVHRFINEAFVSAVLSVFAVSTIAFDTDATFYRTGHFNAVEIESSLVEFLFCEKLKHCFVFSGGLLDSVYKIKITETAEIMLFAFSQNTDQWSVDEVIFHKRFASARVFSSFSTRIR